MGTTILIIGIIGCIILVYIKNENKKQEQERLKEHNNKKENELRLKHHEEEKKRQEQENAKKYNRIIICPFCKGEPVYRALIIYPSRITRDDGGGYECLDHGKQEYILFDPKEEDEEEMSNRLENIAKNNKEDRLGEIKVSIVGGCPFCNPFRKIAYAWFEKKSENEEIVHIKSAYYPGIHKEMALILPYPLKKMYRIKQFEETEWGEIFL